MILEEVSKPDNEWFQTVPCQGIKEKKGFSCRQVVRKCAKAKVTKEDIGKVFISTHRARSKFYDSFDKIPMSAINKIDSTG